MSQRSHRSQGVAFSGNAQSARRQSKQHRKEELDWINGSENIIIEEKKRRRKTKQKKPKGLAKVLERPDSKPKPKSELEKQKKKKQ